MQQTDLYTYLMALTTYTSAVELISATTPLLGLDKTLNTNHVLNFVIDKVCFMLYLKVIKEIKRKFILLAK